MEQEVQLKAKQGFRIISNKLEKFTINGRKRNHWKTHYRHLSKKHLKNRCENRRCTTIHNLTIHHKIPLSSAKSEEELKKLCEKENCQTLCDKCHKELEQRISLERNGKAKKKKKFKKKVARQSRKKLRKVKLVKSKSGLILEQDEWGCYRIIN